MTLLQLFTLADIVKREIPGDKYTSERIITDAFHACTSRRAKYELARLAELAEQSPELLKIAREYQRG
jgi:hypothetical protein